MSRSVKGPGQKPATRPSERSPSAQAAAARAFVRLTKTKKGGAAAEVVGDRIDDVVRDDPDEAEAEEAQRLMDAVPHEPSAGDDMEKAQAIADTLAKEIEATRDRRRDLAARIRRGFDEL